jgi:uncharacterized protein YhaN
MTDNIDLTFLRRQLADMKAEGGKLAEERTGGSGGPPEDKGLEKRVEALEKSLPEIKERLARVETKLDSVEKSMATKADLEAVRGAISTDLHKAIGDATWRFVQISVVLAGLSFTAAKFIHP